VAAAIELAALGRRHTTASTGRSSCCLFTEEFAVDLLDRPGFSDARPCEYQRTASAYPEIVSLDDRPRESLFVEAAAP
jgi:hypothetical protein